MTLLCYTPIIFDQVRLSSSLYGRPSNIDLEKFTNNKKLQEFIKTNVNLCEPDRVYFCNGSKEEQEKVYFSCYSDVLICWQLCKDLVNAGVFKPVTKRPGSYWARTDPGDVARVENRTFICSKRQEDAGPTNNWEHPEQMKVINPFIVDIDCHR